MQAFEVNLYPTKFILDVVICSDKDHSIDFFKKRYGESKEYYQEYLTPNTVYTVQTTADSECKGETKIVMHLSELNDPILVHECVHVLFHLSKLCGLGITYKSQEWSAYFIQHLFEEIKSIAEVK